MERSVVFILSTNYAGSHYLSLLLGSHPRALHVGEVKRLRRPNSPKPICQVCGARCRLFEGVEPGDYTGVYTRVFENAPALGRPDVRVLIDNSKHPRWAEEFLGDPGFHVRAIHLIRDPRALIRRWAANHERRRRGARLRYRLVRRRPDLALPGLWAEPRRFYLYRWLMLNQAITRFTRRHRLDTQVVTYRDVASAPEGELGRLMPWLGLAFDPGQIEYWNTDHHGSQKPEYDWVKADRVRFVDTRWQAFLTPEEQAWVADHGRTRRYLARLGLEFAPDGLTRSER